MKMKKMITLGLGLIMSLSLVACGNANTPNVQPPSNFADFTSLSEAIQDVGFDINVPQVIEGYDKCSYRSDKTDGMLEVIFENGDEDIRFRKAVGEDDPSGNYNKFAETKTVEVDGVTITMKGDDGKVNVAIWTKDGYAYSVDSTSPIEKVDMIDYVKVVNTESTAPIGGDPATWGPADDPMAPPSPFIDCDTMKDASELAGFDMVLPGTPDLIQAWENTMIQAFYGEDGNDMFIRKAVGTEDCSGDYNTYAQEIVVNDVTLKGENDAFCLAIWEKDGYTYSVSVGKALNQTDMLALVAAIL